MSAVLPVAPLFVPGNRPERFAKAAASGADAVIIDLEDAVDASEKDAARAHMQAFAVEGAACPLYVRVNGADTEWWADDLAAVAARTVPLAGIIVPKSEDPAALAEAGRHAPVLALIETAVGIARLADLLAVEAVAGLAFGSLDYGLDLGCEPDWEPLMLARQTLVLQARLAGRPAPIDGVTPAFDDADLVAREAVRARAMGFGGKLAIHPRQLAPIQAAFRPDAREIDRARQVLAAAHSDSAVAVAGRMVDKPLVEQARQVLARAGLPADGPQ